MCLKFQLALYIYFYLFIYFFKKLRNSMPTPK